MKKIKYLLFFSLVFIISTSLNASSSFLIVNEESEINKDITLTVDLNSIDYDNFTFRLLSSNSLDSVDSENLDLVNNNEEITFDYCINCSKLDKLTLTYKLPSDVKVGDIITFYAEVINKQNENEKISVRKTVTIIDENKMEEEKDKKEDNKKETTQRQGFSIKQTSKKSTFKISNVSRIKKVTYKGSDNNYLKSLSVSNYNFQRKFSKDGLTYFVTVKNNIKSIKVNAKSENSKAKISISGNSNLKVGINKVLVTVTSESGKTRNYRIYVTREE